MNSPGTFGAAEVKKETAWYAWISRTFSHRPSRVGKARGQGQPGAPSPEGEGTTSEEVGTVGGASAEGAGRDGQKDRAAESLPTQALDSSPRSETR